MQLDAEAWAPSPAGESRQSPGTPAAPLGCLLQGAAFSQGAQMKCPEVPETPSKPRCYESPYQMALEDDDTLEGCMDDTKARGSLGGRDRGGSSHLQERGPRACFFLTLIFLGHEGARAQRPLPGGIKATTKEKTRWEGGRGVVGGQGLQGQGPWFSSLGTLPAACSSRGHAHRSSGSPGDSPQPPWGLSTDIRKCVGAHSAT